MPGPSRPRKVRFVPPRHQPLVWILAAMCLGIVADRQLEYRVEIWWSLAMLSGLMWWGLWRIHCRHGAELFLLLAVMAASGSWHHQCFSLFCAGELGRYADEAARPVCVEALALSAPELVLAPPQDPLSTMPQGDQCHLRVQLTHLRHGLSWQRATGRGQLTVEGHLLGVEAGDRLRIFALLAAPARPHHPGQFDAAAYWRGQRQLCLLRATHPACVTVVARGSWWYWRRWLEAIRRRGNALLQQNLHPQRAGLASAILLGNRQQLDRRRQEEFLTSGTVHILAISGLHLGMLAYGFWLAARLAALSRRCTLWSAMGLVIAYALVAGARPPVVRAALFVLAACTARLLGRRALAWNTMAAAGILVLLINPCNLFRTGVHLSFLAVATLACCTPWLLPHERPRDPLDQLIARSRPWPMRWLRAMAGQLVRLWLASALIWLVTLPLIMHRFHLLTPIASFLNPVLWPLVAAGLFSGFALLVVGWLIPPLAPLLGWVCDWSLRMLESIVQLARSIPCSYSWTHGPPSWWVMGCYLLLGMLLACWRGGRLRPLLLWLLLGWGVTGGVTLCLPPRKPAGADDALVCTFLSVGHGTCVVLQLPDDRVWMYDAGHLGPPDSAARLIFQYLCWQRIRRLDAVVLSHADADHYNALPQLLQRIRVNRVYVSPYMFQQPAAALRNLSNSLRAASVAIRRLGAGQTLSPNEATHIEVLHPTAQLVGQSDNATSIVLRITSHGKAILLPGDLEGAGLTALLTRSPRCSEVVMAPHHGSPGSNPAQFARWSTPKWIISSGGHGADLKSLRAAAVAVGAGVLHTAHDGAVRVILHRSGLLVHCWRENAWRAPPSGRTIPTSQPAQVGLPLGAGDSRRLAAWRPCGHSARFELTGMFATRRVDVDQLVNHRLQAVR